ncbi:hypothetical protein M5689_000491 [Euphorbia peplus]|nr:hypothetical protein M5689_000491 [Euphorbia peplus]
MANPPQTLLLSEFHLPGKLLVCLLFVEKNLRARKSICKEESKEKRNNMSKESNIETEEEIHKAKRVKRNHEKAVLAIEKNLYAPKSVAEVESKEKCNISDNLTPKKNNLEIEVSKEKSNLKSKRLLEKSVALPEKKEKAKRLYISLTKDQIEEDIMLITGGKPVGNPKKMKSRYAKRILDLNFPGLMLCHINPNSYNLREKGVKNS